MGVGSELPTAEMPLGGPDQLALPEETSRFESLAQGVREHQRLSRRPAVPTAPADHRLYRALDQLEQPG